MDERKTKQEEKTTEINCMIDEAECKTLDARNYKISLEHLKR